MSIKFGNIWCFSQNPELLEECLQNVDNFINLETSTSTRSIRDILNFKNKNVYNKNIITSNEIKCDSLVHGKTVKRITIYILLLINQFCDIFNWYKWHCLVFGLNYSNPYVNS